jgi:general secretion pathway protein D
MKHAIFVVPIALTLAAGAASAQVTPVTKAKAAETISSFDPPDPVKDKELLPPAQLNFNDAELIQVLEIYQELSGRSIIRGSGLPPVKISFKNQTALNHREALQALDTVLSQNGIVMIPMGTKYMKVVPTAQAPTEAVPVVELPREQLPESGSYMIYLVELKTLRPTEVAPALAPLCKSPNSVIAMDQSNVLLLRDYSTNIRRMLQVLEALESRESSRKQR